MEYEMKWNLKKNGNFYLSGEGRVPDLSQSEGTLVPWEHEKSKIRHVHVEEGIIELNIRAFAGCKNLRTVVLPKSLKRIHYGCFADCSRLTNVIVPDGVEFQYLHEVETEENDAAKIKFGINSFYGTPWALKKWGNFYIKEGKLMACFSKDEVLTVPEDVHTIGMFAFRDTVALKIDLPNGVKRVEKLAMADTKIKVFRFPETIEYIGEYAFSGSLVEEIIVPYEVKATVCDHAFDTFVTPFKSQKKCPFEDGYQLTFRSAGKEIPDYKQIIIQKKTRKKIEGTEDQFYGLLTSEALSVGDCLLRRMKKNLLILAIRYDKAAKKVIKVRSYCWDPWECEVIVYWMTPIVITKENVPEADLWDEEYWSLSESRFKSQLFVASVPRALDSDSDFYRSEYSMQEDWFCIPIKSREFGFHERQLLKRWLVKHEGYTVNGEIFC